MLQGQEDTFSGLLSRLDILKHHCCFSTPYCAQSEAENKYCMVSSIYPITKHMSIDIATHHTGSDGFIWNGTYLRKFIEGQGSVHQHTEYKQKFRICFCRGNPTQFHTTMTVFHQTSPFHFSFFYSIFFLVLPHGSANPLPPLYPILTSTILYFSAVLWP